MAKLTSLADLHKAFGMHYKVAYHTCSWIHKVRWLAFNTSCTASRQLLQTRQGPMPALQDHFILIFVSGHMTMSNAHQLLECPGDSHFTEVFQLQTLAIGRLVIRLQMFRLHQATG